MAATNHGCDQFGCKGYFSYIRYKKKWIKIGAFHSKCKSFILFDDIKMPENNKPKSNLSTSDVYFHNWLQRKNRISAKTLEDRDRFSSIL